MTALMARLEDSNVDVQGFAVKCLSSLCLTLNPVQVQKVVKVITDNVLNVAKPEVLNISATALKTIVLEVPEAGCSAAVKDAAAQLVGGVENTKLSLECRRECLDLLTEVCRRFASHVAPLHTRLSAVLLRELSSGNDAMRKRATVCIGAVVPSFADKLFEDFVASLIGSLDPKDKAGVQRTRSAVQGLMAVTHKSGARISHHVGTIVPAVLRLASETGPLFAEEDDLKESCLQCLEALVLRCPASVGPHVPGIVDRSLALLTHDPNYIDDGMDVDGGEDDHGDDDDDDDDDGGNNTDDDDTSWKVRRAAAKALAAVVLSRPELISDVYARVAPVLVKRFREREENVRVDNVFAAFAAVLRQTAVLTRRIQDLEGPERASAPGTPAGLLSALVPQVLAELLNQLKAKSLKTREGVYALLKEVAETAPHGSLSGHVPKLIAAIAEGLASKRYVSAGSKIQTLQFARELARSCPAAVIQPHLSKLFPTVLACVNDKYYKLTAEGLRVCSELVGVLRPGNAAAAAASSFDPAPFVQPLYTHTFERLKAQDVDQEVKEAAITCMGRVVAALGDKVSPAELNASVSLLRERLGNEITRLVAVRVFQAIAESPLKIDLRSVLDPTAKELAGFLRKAHRALRIAAFGALTALAAGPNAAHLGEPVVEDICKDVAPLLADSDLHLAHLSVELAAQLVRNHAAGVKLVHAHLLPRVLSLTLSPLVQGAAASSLVAFYEALTVGLAAGASGKGKGAAAAPESLLASLEKGLADLPEVSVHTYGNTADCLASVACRLPKPEAVAAKYAEDLGAPAAQMRKVITAAYALGALGRRVDLSSPQLGLAAKLVDLFSSESDEVKLAASLALGNLALGNLKAFLPNIISFIGSSDSSARHQYLVLHALKEIISRSRAFNASAALGPDLDKILKLLFAYADSGKDEDAGLRNVVSECLGKLAVSFSDKVFPELLSRIGGSAPMKVTLLTALKFTISERSEPALAALLQQHVGAFFRLLSDENHDVRRAATVVLTCAARFHPRLVSPLLAEILPPLYKETEKKEELVKSVKLGPFEHRVDAGLEDRRCAFECLDTLLEGGLHVADAAGFVRVVARGLEDEHDNKVICHMMIQRLAAVSGPFVLAAASLIVPIIQKTVTAPISNNAVEQEVARRADLVRSSLRAVEAMTRIPNWDSAAELVGLVDICKKDQALSKVFDEVSSGKV
jgi:cullin-associated NEDD8-dissociated protein 1